MKRPRMTAQIVNGLAQMNIAVSAAPIETLFGAHDHERLSKEEKRDLDDYQKAADWLDDVRSWYIARGMGDPAYRNTPQD